MVIRLIVLINPVCDMGSLAEIRGFALGIKSDFSIVEVEQEIQLSRDRLSVKYRIASAFGLPS